MDRVNVSWSVWHGPAHLRCYTPRANVVAICDVDPARLQAVGKSMVLRSASSTEELFAMPVARCLRCRTSRARR